MVTWLRQMKFHSYSHIAKQLNYEVQQIEAELQADLASAK